MGQIASWLSEQQQAAEANIMVDDTLHYLNQRKRALDAFLPPRMYDTRDFLAYVVDKVSPVASLVAYGAELPTTQVGKFNKITGDLFKAGLSFDYPEERQWQMREALEKASAKGLTVQSQVLPNGAVIPGANSTLADYLFGTIADMARALTDLNYLIAAQAVQFGFVNYEDTRTSVRLPLDYRDADATYGYAPNGKFAHFPPDLTATPQAWNQYVTADGLQNLENDVEVFRDTNGYMPTAILMSHKLRLHLRNQESTKRSFSSISNSAASVVVSNVGVVSNLMLDRLFEDMGLPPIIICDEMYNLPNGGGKMRFFNPDRYVFLTQGMGEQAMGPTLENEGAPGPFVVTREVTKFPPRDATQGVATMLPVIPNPKLLFARRAA